jgi:alpha-galactosidase
MKPIRFFLLLACATISAQAKPLKIFILAGQSNMQGHAKISTIEHIGMDPKTKPMMEEMLQADGTPRTCQRVWISSIGCGGNDTEEQTGKHTAGFGATKEKIGPEFTFGLTMEKLTDSPILLIKTSWGGKSLNTDFRPPSAGPYVFNETQLANFTKQGKNIDDMKAAKAKETGVYYKLMMEHVKKVLGDIKRVVPDYDEKQGYELAGFAWFQGWNDMVDGGTYPQRDKPGGYDAYTEVMVHFIRDVRKELNAPKLPFAIGVIGVGGPTALYGPGEKRYQATHQNLRDAMAAPAKMPEFQGSVTAVLTEQYWDLELSAAKAKENELKQQAKKTATEKKLSAAEEKAAFEALRKEKMTEREQNILAKGISNLEFHYLGCAKILGGIGKGLAEAMTPMGKK